MKQLENGKFVDDNGTLLNGKVNWNIFICWFNFEFANPVLIILQLGKSVWIVSVMGCDGFLEKTLIDPPIFKDTTFPSSVISVAMVLVA